MADELQGGTPSPSGGAPSTSAPSAPAPSTPSALPSASTPSSPSSPATPSSISSPGSPQAGGQPAPMTARDALRQYGLDLTGQFQDDHSALQHVATLYQQARQQADLARYGQQYVQYAGDFQAFLAERQKQAQAAQAQQQGWWKAPEFDPSWSSKLMRDPQTGELRVIPGADPSIAQKYMAFVEHRQNFIDRFSTDPMKAIEPGVREIAMQMARQVVQEQLGGYQEASAADQFISQNSEWLHARDQSGRVLMAPTGKPALSPLGQRFAGYVQQAEAMGLRTVEQQRTYALNLTRADYFAAMMQQQQGQQPGTPTSQPQTDPAREAKNAFMAQQQQRGAPVAPPATNMNGSPPPVGNSQKALQDAMMQAMTQGGFAPGQTIIA